jgi:LysR family transcriptional regulator, carnitine catabolism transcriptional activator
MDLRRLSLFLAVVEHGSFTRAAAASYLSQPGLSQAIRELETELGTALFDRIGRRVTLTAAGEALVGYARQALREVDAGRIAVAAVMGVEAGTVALGCLPTLAADPTARLVGEFRRAHPGVRVELAAPDDSEDLHSMLRAGLVELAVTELPTATRGLLVHKLAAQDLVVVLPPGTDAPRVMTLRDLASRPLIVTSPGTSSRRVLDDALSKAGVEAHVAVQTAQREALVPLVLAGAGATLLPRTVAATAAVMGAVLADTSPVLTRPIGLLHRESVFSPLAAAFWAGATGSPPNA